MTTLGNDNDYDHDNENTEARCGHVPGPSISA
jgi:hypothetical protein